MRIIIFIAMLLVVTSTTNIFAQKTNLDKLPEKERKEYLLKKAYEAVMTYGPDWYRDYKEPEITSYVVYLGPDIGQLVYMLRYFYDTRKEKMEMKYAYIVEIYAETGEVRDLSFGNGVGISLFLLPKTRSGNEKPIVVPCPYPRPQ